MSQSVKLSDGSYIDAGAVWDATQGKTQESINAFKPTTVYQGGRTMSGTVAGENIDTANPFTIPKGLNLVQVHATYDGEPQHLHGRVVKLLDGGSWTTIVAELDQIYFVASTTGGTSYQGYKYHCAHRTAAMVLSQDTPVYFECYTQNANTSIYYYLSYIHLSD